MAAAPLSPVAAARIGALLVPAGKVKKSRFEGFVERLRPESLVKLGDISPSSESDRNSFSPLAFPNGIILYNFTTSKPSDSHEQLFPLELFRIPFVVIGVADGQVPSSRSEVNAEPGQDGLASSADQHLTHLEAQLRSRYQNTLSVQLLVFDSPMRSLDAPAILIPPKGESKSTTIKTVMCDVSAKVLSEMSSFSRTIQAQDSIQSPGVYHPVQLLTQHTNSKHDLQRGAPPDARRGRAQSLEEQEGTARRMSSSAAPAQAPSALQKRERSRSPFAQETSPPRFDSSSSLDLSHKSRDTAVSRLREKSRDRRSLPSISPDERAKNILKLRQGLILGSLYLLAGHWSDALRELVDNTTRAKVFSDHFWYAKGLENILACMILLTWARMDFTIPSVCFANSEKPASLRHTPSSNLVRSSQSTDADDDHMSRTLSNLSMVIPDLIFSIANHYRREDGTDKEALPQSLFSESVIRLSYLTAVSHRYGGQLNERAIRHLVLGSPSTSAPRHTSRTSAGPHMQSAKLANLVFEALPSEATAATLPIVDIITIMSGVVSVLSVARLYRKRAMVIREAIALLIPKLIQARKVGAAEMGIHPAASLAARHGLTVDSTSGAAILNSNGNEVNFHDLLVLLCGTFGIVGVDSPLKTDTTRTINDTASPVESSAFQEILQRSFGGFELKSEILRLCANFSESLPNFHDVVRFTTAILRTAGPGSAPVDGLSRISIQLPREDQLRFANKITRTLGVFKSEDAAKLEADYWDLFLVRDIFLQDGGQARVLALSGNIPDVNLLSEHSNDTIVRSTFVTVTAPADVLIANESNRIVVSVQNLYDFEVILESVKLVSSGVELISEPIAAVLPPRARQHLVVQATATEPGEARVTSCRIKVQGCREQIFQIFPDAWKPDGDTKIKSMGLKLLEGRSQRPSSSTATDLKPIKPSEELAKPVIKSYQVLHEQPRLAVDPSGQNTSTLNLLEGETKGIELILRNTSRRVSLDFLRFSFDYAVDHDTHGRSSSTFPSPRIADPVTLSTSQSSPNTIDPGTSFNNSLVIQGQLGLTQATVHIDYAHTRTANQEDHLRKILARRVSVPYKILVEPSVSLDSVRVVDQGSSRQIVAVDLFNAHVSPLAVALSKDEQRLEDHTTVLDPCQSSRLLVPLSDMLKSIQERHDGQSLAKWALHWSEPSSGRTGKVLIPGQQMVAILNTYQERFDATMSVHTKHDSQPSIQSGNVWVIKLQESLTINVKVTNLCGQRRRPLVTFGLKPTLHAARAWIGIADCLVWSGSLRHELRKVEPKESVNCALSICALVEGQYNVEATVQDLDVAVAHGMESACEDSSVGWLGSSTCTILAKAQV